MVTAAAPRAVRITERDAATIRWRRKRAAVDSRWRAPSAPAQIFRNYAAPHKSWARCGKKGHDGAAAVAAHQLYKILRTKENY
jgi:hypothetical protein